MKPVILLSNLRAEGGPALAADLASEWRKSHDPSVLLLNDQAMDMADRLDSIGVRYEVLGIPAISAKYYPAIVSGVRDALKRHKADSLISIPTGVHGAIFTGAALAGVRRRVVHVGNYPWHWQDGFRKYRLLMRLSAPMTPDLVCVTQHVAEGVNTHFGRVARRVHVISNGIDLSAFPFRGEILPSKDKLEVLMVGRLDIGKDHETLINAVAKLKARNIPIKLNLAGDGQMKNVIENQVARLGLNEQVALLGPRRDVSNLLSKAHVFAFSVAPEEGLGIALVEAMAVGTPIVATDVGACREVLDNGRCGKLVPQKDAEALANAIVDAASAPATQLVAARERAERYYSRTAMAAAYGRLCGFQDQPQ